MAAAITSRDLDKGTMRILIVDDHPVVRQGLRMTIEGELGLMICGEAEGMSQAVQLFHETKPDMVVSDITLENGSGLELVRDLISLDSGLNILVCSMHEETLYAERALQAGARGYINKKEAADLLVTAVRHVAAGHVYLSSRMTDRLLCRRSGGSSTESQSTIETLSDRELEVFEQIGLGLTTREVADKLLLSHKTIETYRENIKFKLSLLNATQLTRHAVQWVLENG